MKKSKEELFIEGYKSLCDKYKRRLVVMPSWKLNHNGEYVLTLQTNIEKQEVKK